MPNNTPAGAQQRACSWLQHNLSTTMCRALIVLARDPRKRHPEGRSLRSGTLDALQNRGLAEPTTDPRRPELGPVWMLTTDGQQAHRDLVTFTELEHHHTSANIASYRDAQGQDPEPYLYVRVLTTSLNYKTREILERAEHSISVSRNRQGGDFYNFRYVGLPGHRGPLSADTVAHLVREALGSGPA